MVVILITELGEVAVLLCSESLDYSLSSILLVVKSLQ